MADPAYPVDPEVVEDLLAVERCSTFLGSGPLRPEFWEVFALLKANRSLVLDEVNRLAELRADGRPATIAMELTEKLLDIRRDHYGLASDLRPFLSKTPGMRDGMRLELALVFIMSAARGRESAAAWLADPAGTAVESGTRIQLMGRMADAYCRALMSARRAANVPLPEPPPAAAAPPSPTAPEEEDIILKPTEDPPPPPASPLPIEAATPNVESPKAAVPSPPPKTVARAASRLHPQFLEDLEIVQRLQRALEGPKPSPPAWEVHALVSPRPAALPGQIAELERLRHSGKPGEFAGAAYAMREKIREAKSRHEVLAEKLRSYLEKIFNGWQGEAEEIAFAVLLGSANGRQRAELWLREPGLSMNEARVLVESFVDRAREHLEKGGKVATGS